MLYHVSEQPDISRFDPRPSELVAASVVWAIDSARLRNYLVPRDCPRVTFYAGPLTNEEDRVRFLGTASAVVVVEEGWLDRVRRCRLDCYQVPQNSFEAVDDCAGYYVRRHAVTPAGIEIIEDAGALEQRGVELRTVPGLWPIRDAVVASSLQFSVIRMRNALSGSGAR